MYVGAFFKKLSFEALSKEVSVIWYFLMYFLSQIPSGKTLTYIDQTQRLWSNNALYKFKVNTSHVSKS